MQSVQAASASVSADLSRRGAFNDLRTRILTVMTSGVAHQTFLGNPLLPSLIRIVPASRRRGFVLRLLGISPHYFTERYTARYPDSMPTGDILERELERNVVSRQLLFRDVVEPYLEDRMTALDFGCGIGVLASMMAPKCRSMIGVDISRGVLACGAVLFPVRNLRFVVTGRDRIEGAADASVDLLTAIAVAQHMDDATLDRTLAEFRRVLAPGARALLHIPLAETAAATPQATQHQDRRNPVARLLQRQFGLFMVYRDRQTVEAMIARHGFAIEASTVIGALSSIEDDIKHQHLFVLRKPDTAARNDRPH